MIGFFQEELNKKSMSRWCMFWGNMGGVISGIALVVAVAFYTVTIPSWLCAVPISLMIGGCLPYVFNKANDKANKALKNPKLIKAIIESLK